MRRQRLPLPDFPLNPRSCPAPSTGSSRVFAGISFRAASISSMDPKGSRVPCTNITGTSICGRCCECAADRDGWAHAKDRTAGGVRRRVAPLPAACWLDVRHSSARQRTNAAGYMLRPAHRCDRILKSQPIARSISGTRGSKRPLLAKRQKNPQRSTTNPPPAKASASADQQWHMRIPARPVGEN